MADPTLAIDIGGTKIAVGLVDDHGALVHRAQAADTGRRTPRRCGRSSTR